LALVSLATVFIFSGAALANDPPPEPERDPLEAVEIRLEGEVVSNDGEAVPEEDTSDGETQQSSSWICLGAFDAWPNYWYDQVYYYGNSTCTETMSYQLHTFIVHEYDSEEGWQEVHSDQNSCRDCIALRSPESGFYVFEAASGTQVRVYVYYYACGYTGGCDGRSEIFGPWIF